MLKVTDLRLLPYYGFKREGTNRSGREIWSLAVGDYGSEIRFTVNPREDGREEIENELAIWTEVDIKYKDHAENFGKFSHSCMELDFDCDILAQLITDGVVYLDKSRKAVA